MYFIKRNAFNESIESKCIFETNKIVKFTYLNTLNTYA